MTFDTYGIINIHTRIRRPDSISFTKAYSSRRPCKIQWRRNRIFASPTLSITFKVRFVAGKSGPNRARRRDQNCSSFCSKSPRSPWESYKGTETFSDITTSFIQRLTVKAFELQGASGYTLGIGRPSISDGRFFRSNSQAWFSKVYPAEVSFFLVFQFFAIARK